MTKADPERPIVNIEGNDVALGPLRRDLIPSYQRWNNDFVTTRTLARSQPTTFEQETTSYEQMTESEHGIFFTIYERTTWRAIGLTYLWQIDYRNRTAEFGIVIGEADCRGKSYGTATACLMLDYAFTVLGLHNVFLTVYEYNVAGRRAYEKAGFREFGRRRQCHQMGGRLWDVIYMEGLASEFIDPNPRSTFVVDVPIS